jgi:membrane-bound lytic murein transglycosylase F
MVVAGDDSLGTVEERRIDMSADYVDRIRARWSEYCGGASFHESYRGGSRGPGIGRGTDSFNGAPVKSKRNYQRKYHI